MTRSHVLAKALTVIQRHYTGLFEQLTADFGPAVAAQMVAVAILNLKLVLPPETALKAEPEYRAPGEFP